MENYLQPTGGIKRVKAGARHTFKIECICRCGKIVWVNKYKHSYNKVKSCGCLKNDGGRARTHGMTNTKEYRAYNAMFTRCYWPKATHYEDYHGRGITVCERWHQSFTNFYQDMGACPSKDHSIDRIENDKGYYKENCRWATPIEQANNKRNNRVHIHNGVRYSQRAFAEFLGVNYNSMKNWCNKYKMTDEEIVNRYKKIDTAK